MAKKEVKQDLINKEEVENNKSMDQGDSLNKVKLDSLVAEKEDWKNKAMRFAADLQNTQRQSQIDILNNTKSTKKRVVNGLSQFLNTLYISFAFIPEGINEEGKKFIDTLKFSFNSLVGDLKTLNIEVITPKIDDEFDPNTMSALNEGQVESDGLGFLVDNVVSIGFKVDDQIISPSTVILKNKK